MSCKREAICGKSKNLGFPAGGLGGSVPCRPLVRYLHSVELLPAAAVPAEVTQIQPDEQNKHTGKDDRGQRVDLRRNAALGHRVDGDGQVAHARARGEEAHHEVVDGHGQRHHKAGKHARHDVRQNHLEEALHRRRAQILRRLGQIRVDLAQLGHHAQHHVGHAERDMRQQQGQIAELNVGHRVEQHQRNAGDDLGVEHRQIDDAQQRLARKALHLVERNRADRAEEGRKDGRQQADGERRAQRGHDRRVGKQLLIPPERKASPVRAGFAVVEGIENQQNDRRIQKRHNQRDIRFSELFHQRMRTSFRGSSSLSMR